MKIDYAALGERVRKYRKAKEWTQADLAEAAERSNNTISHIENGTGKFELQTIVNIANALEVSVDALLCDSLKNSGTVYKSELAEYLEGCSSDEIRLIKEVVPPVIETLRRNIKKQR